jgi:protein YIPF1/2
VEVFGRLNITNLTLTSTRKQCVKITLHYRPLSHRVYQVWSRCYATLIPSSTDYFSTHLNPVDLYGPFWTLTTLIFTLFLSSSLAASISSYLSDPGEEYDYNFTLLSIAVSLVYAYGIAVPVLLWVALRYLGVGEWSVVEAMAIWGYSMFVWVPVSVRLVDGISTFKISHTWCRSYA